jgi:hypothetical protein
MSRRTSPEDSRCAQNSGVGPPLIRIAERCAESLVREDVGAGVVPEVTEILHAHL